MSERHYNNETRTERLLQLIERDGPNCMGKGCLVHLASIKPIDVHVHHIKPLKEGGCDHIENQVALCRTCHSKERLGTLEIRSSSVTRLGLCVCVSGNTVVDNIANGNGNGHADTLTDAKTKAGEGGRVYIDAQVGGFRYQTAQDLAKERVDAEALQAAKEDAALTPVMRVNKRCEKPFNEWINRMIQVGWKHDYETWANAGAQEFRCSPETIKKYLNKRCNPINGDLFTMTDDDESTGDTKSYLAFRKLVE